MVCGSFLSITVVKSIAGKTLDNYWITHYITEVQCPLIWGRYEIYFVVYYNLPGPATAFRVAAVINNTPGYFLEAKPVPGLSGIVRVKTGLLNSNLKSQPYVYCVM